MARTKVTLTTTILLLACSPGSEAARTAQDPPQDLPAARPADPAPAALPDGKVSGIGDLFVAHGACPFECCTYGAWEFDSSVVVQHTPTDTAAVMALVPPNTPLATDSGIVVVRPGVVVFDAPVRDEEGGNTFEAGDTLLLLDYLGEGYQRGWHGGDTLTIFAEFWGDLPSSARVVRDARQVWWAHVAQPESLAGWIRMRRGVFADGSDACG